ncbi:GNAT family N-acetyltransferase [Moorena producens]|uniref:GNAT family N-acetyltransferase n=1 Tax=Moorena producens TaxID=1155739 RepID=UPI0009F2DD76|nr:GNAT family N-acetyltransferase [Moorena producens]
MTTTYSPQITYQWLENFDAAASLEYDDYTCPSIASHWQGASLLGELLGLAAVENDEMVGLLVAELRKDPKTDTTSGVILSLFVHPENRRQGVGSGLITHLEAHVRELGCTQMELSYQATELTTVALEPLLERLGWETPKISLILAKFDSEHIAQAPWVHHYRFPKDFTLFPWAELTPAQEERIHERQKQKVWYPESLSPFLEPSKLEPLNSLGLLYQGEVVGWMVNHRVGPDTIRYTSMFVVPRFQRRGRGAMLIAESLMAQLDSDIAYYTFAVGESNQPMLEFVDRRLKPYLTSLTEAYRSLKKLGSRE